MAWKLGKNLNGPANHVTFAIQILDTKSVWNTENLNFEYSGGSNIEHVSISDGP